MHRATLRFRLRLAIYAFREAFRKAQDALEATHNSNTTGHGWDAYEYGDGFIDLYGPCSDEISSIIRSQDV